MMVSEGVTTAILVVAGIVIAAMVASTVISQYYMIDSTIRGASRGVEDRLRTRVEVVHGAVEGDHFVVFVKNTGRRVIAVSEVESADVYFGRACETLYRLGSGPRTWSYEELYADGVWSIGETLILRIYNGTAVGPPPYCVKIVLPNGVVSEGVIVG
jgi:hypothetical protein